MMKYLVHYVRNDLITHLTNSLKKKYLLKLTLHKKKINLREKKKKEKNKRTAIEFASLDSNNLIIRHIHVHE